MRKTQGLMSGKKWRNRLSLIILSSVMLSCASMPDFTKEQLDDPDKLLEIGRMYYSSENYHIAIQIFQIILTRHSKRTYNCAWAQYEIGMCYYLDGEFEKAKAAFHKVRLNYPLPRQPRILARKLIRKIDRKDTHKKSSYVDR